MSNTDSVQRSDGALRPRLNAIDRAMQALAVASIGQAWDDAPTPPADLDTEAEAALLRALGRPGRAFHREQASVARANGRFLITDPPSWSALQRAVLARTTPPGLLAHLRDRAMPRKLRPGHAASLDAEAFLAQATASLADQRLQLRLAKLIRNLLRQRMIFSPGPAPAPELSVIGLWSVIGASNPPPRLTEAVRAAAKSLQDQPNWAGFWEQATLHRLLEKPGNVNEELLTLPILERGAAGLKGQETDPRLKKDWQQDIPGLAASILGNRL